MIDNYDIGIAIKVLKATRDELLNQVDAINTVLELYESKVENSTDNNLFNSNGYQRRLRSDEEVKEIINRPTKKINNLKTCKNPGCTNLFESIDNEEYCGERCKRAHKPVKKEREKKICPNCKKEFTPKASAQKFCSKECKPYKISKRKELNTTLKEIEERRKQPYPLTSN